MSWVCVQVVYVLGLILGDYQLFTFLYFHFKTSKMSLFPTEARFSWCYPIFFVSTVHQFKKAQEIFELKKKESTMQAEIQGGKTVLRNLGSKQHKLDEEVLKQQEVLYTQVK